MKRSITTWTTTLATAALLGLPAAAIAKPQQPSTPPQEQQPAPQPQQPQPQPAPQPTQPPTEPQPTQPPTQPQPTQPQQPQPAPQPTQPQPTQPPTEPQPTTPPSATSQQPPAATTAADQNLSPEEHLRQAREAYTAIKATSIPARDRAQFTELRRHLTALENSTASGASAKMPSSGKSAKADNWGTEVAAIDRILTKLVGSDTGTAAGGTSTAGATGTAGSSRTASSAMDEATRSKLMDIRTHITAYAAAKSGASSTPRSDAAAMPNEASTAQGQQPNPAPNPQANPAQSPQPNPAQTSQPNPADTPQPNPAQNAPAQPATSPQAAGMPKVDADAAHRELLAARDSLNQLTQLPAAAQLAGDTRTQVQQLIANFNELITNTTDWRASYTKVEGTLNTVLGPETSTATPAETPAPANPATPGAVGTTGAAPQLDPAIRAKLVEMRTHLQEFAKASGGASK